MPTFCFAPVLGALGNSNCHLVLRGIANQHSNAEVSIGIICACLPSLASLISKVLRERRSKQGNGVTRYGFPPGRTSSKCFKGPNVKSQIICPQTTFDQDILISHSQGEGKFETTIRADRPYVGTDYEMAAHPLGGRGILKTIDVSHTVTNV
jgi:hypothetical protein